MSVLVTGSSRGIGFEIAKAFIDEGYAVALNASKHGRELDDALNKLKGPSKNARAFVCDISDYNQCQKMFGDIETTLGPVDILINNAGIAHWGLFQDMKPSEWERVVGVNLIGAINCAHLATEYMLKAKKGAIVNISSIWGVTGASCEAVYSASKAGLNGFTKALGKELGPSGIRVNGIACGLIDTGMNRMFSEEELNAVIDEIPMGRIGKVSDVARLALFLCSDKADYINAQIITLDGGMI